MSKQNRKETSKYDEIIREIGNDGAFQRNFTIIFLVMLVFINASQYISKVISLAVPDHWCNIPGRELTNFTIEEWKNLTIPKENNMNGLHDYSKCAYFLNYEYQNETATCNYGWEYDLTWYDRTTSTENDWVCDNNMIPTDVLAINRVAEMIGTVVFGQMADNFGRKPIFFISVLTILTGRIAMAFISSWKYAFFVFSFLACLPCTAIYQSTLVIAVELSGLHYRAVITMVMTWGWSLGISFSPLIIWWQRDWKIYWYITTIPMAIFIFLYKVMIESPRWLTAKGKNKKCLKVLKKIAKTNKTQLPSNIQKRLAMANNEEIDSNIYTIIHLFSSIRLAKNIIILNYTFTTAVFTYMCMILSAINLNGNWYLNYLFMGLIDLPLALINKYGSDRYGRRPMVLFSFLIMFLGCVTMIFMMQDPSNSIAMNIACIITKCSAAMAFATLNLQVIEICPTCIRQTGASFTATVTNCICILGPYVVALGLNVNVRIPYLIYAICSLLALIGCILLPETLGYQLPDTLEDAAIFGAEQDIWGKKKAYVATKQDEDNTQMGD